MYYHLLLFIKNCVKKQIFIYFLFLMTEIKNYLNKIGIKYNKESELDGYILERNTLVYKDISVYSDEIDEIRKKFFKNAHLTSLKEKKSKEEKWPLLNLTRQILKMRGYKMQPIRKANGYSKDGTKLYKRLFKIQKMVQSNGSEIKQDVSNNIVIEKK